MSAANCFNSFARFLAHGADIQEMAFEYIQNYPAHHLRGISVWVIQIQKKEDIKTLSTITPSLQHR
jgi:hypothetical protein